MIFRYVMFSIFAVDVIIQTWLIGLTSVAMAVSLVPGGLENNIMGAMLFILGWGFVIIYTMRPSQLQPLVCNLFL